MNAMITQGSLSINDAIQKGILLEEPTPWERTAVCASLFLIDIGTIYMLL